MRIAKVVPHPHEVKPFFNNYSISQFMGGYHLKWNSNTSRFSYHSISIHWFVKCNTPLYLFPISIRATLPCWQHSSPCARRVFVAFLFTFIAIKCDVEYVNLQLLLFIFFTIFSGNIFFRFTNKYLNQINNNLHLSPTSHFSFGIDFTSSIR